MKKVLIIDAPPLFRDFLKGKLSAQSVETDTAEGRRDAFTKLLSQLPDLIIIDLTDTLENSIELLEKIQKDPNAKLIPVIVCGPVINREQTELLVQYGVVKYFTKPIKFDLFFEFIGRILKTTFTIDTTQCVLDIHLNGTIIFIEMAQGLNREKISLLRYKLPEIIDSQSLTSPKVILMMSNLDPTFVDGANLELLFDNIIADPRIQKKNVKILSRNSFVHDLIDGHPQYSDIEVVANLSDILNSLVESGPADNVAEVISDRILSASDRNEDGTVETRFYSDAGSSSGDDDEGASGPDGRIAVVDDDAVIRTLLKSTFTTAAATVDLFDSGAEFIAAISKKKYNLAIIDIFMPGLSGFDILKSLQERGSAVPIIVYSQATNREAVIQALSLGAKSYLVKPQKPDVILAKAKEIMDGQS
jgi:DNA-binding response OmpR family regulator